MNRKLLIVTSLILLLLLVVSTIIIALLVAKDTDQLASEDKNNSYIEAKLNLSKVTQCMGLDVTENGSKGTVSFVDHDPSGHLLSDSPHASFGAKCVLERLDAPLQIIEEMKITRGIDGIRQATWGPYEIRWSYDGNQKDLSVIISITSK